REAHLQHARQVLGPLQVAGHPVQVGGSAAQHAASSTIQVSLVPPPCDELTTSEPSRNATRVRPPGTRRVSLPDSTKGRRSIWRGAMPLSTKVGQVDRHRVGWAI